MSVRNLTLGTALGVVLCAPAIAQEAATEGGAGAAAQEQTAQGSANTAQGSANSEAPSADTVVATVGGTEITLGHMIALRERLPEQYRQLPDSALFEGLLAQLINQEALSQKADAESPHTELVLENERRALLANSVLQRAAEDAVTDQAIEQAYQETYGDAGPTTEWNASHILLESEEDAQAVEAELEGGADFAEVAREKSTGPSAPNGGSLGWFGPGMMVPEFEQAIGDLEPGEVSQPFQTQFGWHVAKLNEVRDKEPPTLDEVREELSAQVQRQAVEEAVSAASEDVEVERPDLSGIDPNVLSDTSLID